MGSRNDFSTPPGTLQSCASCHIEAMRSLRIFRNYLALFDPADDATQTEISWRSIWHLRSYEVSNHRSTGPRITLYMRGTKHRSSHVGSHAGKVSWSHGAVCRRISIFFEGKPYRSVTYHVSRDSTIPTHTHSSSQIVHDERKSWNSPLIATLDLIGVHMSTRLWMSRDLGT